MDWVARSPHPHPTMPETISLLMGKSTETTQLLHPARNDDVTSCQFFRSNNPLPVTRTLSVIVLLNILQLTVRRADQYNTFFELVPRGYLHYVYVVCIASFSALMIALLARAMTEQRLPQRYQDALILLHHSACTAAFALPSLGFEYQTPLSFFSYFTPAILMLLDFALGCNVRFHAAHIVVPLVWHVPMYSKHYFLAPVTIILLASASVYSLSQLTSYIAKRLRSPKRIFVF